MWIKKNLLKANEQVPAEALESMREPVGIPSQTLSRSSCYLDYQRGEFQDALDFSFPNLLNYCLIFAQTRLSRHFQEQFHLQQATELVRLTIRTSEPPPCQTRLELDVLKALKVAPQKDLEPDPNHASCLDPFCYF